MDIRKERANAVPAYGSGSVPRVGEPVGVVVVAFGGAVFHELEGLEVLARGVVALEGEGAGLDAADQGVAGDEGGLRGAD